MTLHKFDTVSDLIRILNKIKKINPTLKIVYDTENSFLSRLAIGYTNVDNDIDLIRQDEFDKLEKDKEKYIPVIVFG